MRLFFAVSIPDSVLAVLSSAQQELHTIPGVRLVPRQNMHITLSFLGDVPREELAGLIASAREVDVRGCAVSIGGSLHGFPRSTRWKVAVAGVSDPKALLTQLHRQLPKGNQPEKQFVPHITLARSSVEQNQMPAVHVQQASFEIKEFHLMESILGPQGPRYANVQSFSLKGYCEQLFDKV